MGVHGLWQIIDSVGHPIKLEGLEGKQLGVDANLWLYKFIRGFRDKDNYADINAHKLGLFNRISKLLFYKIKPIFVFDGPAPVLKRKILESRKNKRNQEISKVQNQAVKLLVDQLKRQYPDANLEKVTIQIPQLKSHNLVLAEKLTDEDEELFYLPPEEVEVKQEEKFEEEDIEQHDIDCKTFEELPPELRYEYLKNLRSKVNKRHAHIMPEEAESFSSFQLKKLRSKRGIQEKIEECEMEMNFNGESVRSLRVQSDPTTTILYGRREQKEQQIDTSDIERKPSLCEEKGEEGQNKGQEKQVEKAEEVVYHIDEDKIGYEDDDDEDEMVLLEEAEIDDDDDDETESEKDNDEKRVEIAKQPIYSQEDVSHDLSETDDEDELRENRGVETRSREVENLTSPKESQEMTQHESQKEEGESRDMGNFVKPKDNNDTIDIEETIEINDTIEIDEKDDKINTESGESDDEPVLIEENIEDDDNEDEKTKESRSKEDKEVAIDDDEDDDVVLLNEKQATKKVKTDDDNISSDRRLHDEVKDKLKEPVAEEREKPKETIETQQAESSQRSSSQTITRSIDYINHADIGKSSRMATKVTTRIIDEAKELLKLFGVPYIDAPGEAEAQLALMEQLKLTDGTITDDSDVWLFGAQSVYRHFFSDDKYVLQYKMAEIEFHTRMSRSNLVCFAMLVGSDYTDGIKNVGPVTALDVLNEFSGEGLEPLINFKNWREQLGDEVAKNKKGKNKDINRKREKLLKYKIPEEFPSRVIYEGYMEPVADNSTEKFEWALPDLDDLREYARRNFGWNQEKIDEKLLPVLKKLNERKIQPTIDSFFSTKPRIR